MGSVVHDVLMWMYGYSLVLKFSCQIYCKTLCFPFPYLLECYSLLLSSGKAFLVGIGSGSNVASITWVTVGRQFVLGS